MTAMLALNRARTAWERTSPQLVIDGWLDMLDELDEQRAGTALLVEPAESPYNSPGGLNKCGTGALLLGGTTALHQPVPHQNNDGPGRNLPTEPRDQGQNGA